MKVLSLGVPSAVLVCGAVLLSGPVTENSKDTAQSCEIHVEKIVDIKGDEVGPATIGLFTDDRIFLVRQFASQEIAVFDRSGRFLGTVGREGEGPGEFRSILHLAALPDGGIAAFDSRLGRVTYFSRSLQFEAAHALPVMISRDGAVGLSDGGWILTGRMVDMGAYGSPLVRVDSSGQVVTSFGRNETESEGGLKGMMVTRMVAHHPQFGAVSIKENEYFLEYWEDDGTLKGVFAPEVDWFSWPPDLSGVRHGEYGRPEDMFYGIQFDQEGRLWILARIEGENWEEGVENGRLVDRVKWADFRVEVLDTESRQTLCSVRLTDQLISGGFQGPGVIQSYSEDWLGRPTVTFSQLSLRGP